MTPKAVSIGNISSKAIDRHRCFFDSAGRLFLLSREKSSLIKFIARGVKQRDDIPWSMATTTIHCTLQCSAVYRPLLIHCTLLNSQKGHGTEDEDSGCYGNPGAAGAWAERDTRWTVSAGESPGEKIICKGWVGDSL